MMHRKNWQKIWRNRANFCLFNRVIICGFSWKFHSKIAVGRKWIQPTLLRWNWVQFAITKLVLEPKIMAVKFCKKYEKIERIFVFLMMYLFVALTGNFIRKWRLEESGFNPVSYGGIEFSIHYKTSFTIWNNSWQN